MIRKMLAGGVALVLVLASSAAVRATDKDEVLAAAKKLGEAANYTYTTSQDGTYSTTPAETLYEKDGYVDFWVSVSGGDSFEIILKGNVGTGKGPDSEWKSMAELQTLADAAGGFSSELTALQRMASFSPVAAQVASQVEKAESVKKSQTAATATQKAETYYTVELTEAAAKDMLTFRRPATATGPSMTVKDAKATLTVWVIDGMISKTALHLSGTTTFNEQERQTDRITRVEITKVGTTKFVVPAAALKKLAEKPATAPK